MPPHRLPPPPCPDENIRHIYSPKFTQGSTSLGSYYKFLEKYEKEYKVRLSLAEEKVVEFISKKFASGKRIHELELLNRMMSYQLNLMNHLGECLYNDYHIQLQDKTVRNLINVMTNEFSAGTGKKHIPIVSFCKRKNKRMIIV